MLQWFRRSRIYPAFYQRYLELEPGKIPRKRSIFDNRFIVFDTETTGLNPQQDRLLSIGALIVEHDTIDVGLTFDHYVAQPGNIPMRAHEVAVHGILPDRLNALSEEEAIVRFLNLLGNAVIVAHHAAFDISMINHSLQRLGAGKLKNRYLDTIDLAKRVRPTGYWTRPDDYSLDNLARLYQIPLSDRHTAAGDAYITAILFLKLLARLRERGVFEMGELMRRDYFR